VTAHPEMVSLGSAFARRASGFRAPRLDPGSQWADRHHWLTSGARVGKWTCLEFQREPLDATTDPGVDRVSLMKSTQVGATQMGLSMLGQRMKQRTSSVCVVQPTIFDAGEFSVGEFTPMCEAVEVLRGLVKEPRTKGADTSKLYKRVAGGGVVRFRGANAPTGLRRFGADTLFLDEADGWPATTSEGDPLALAEQRTKDFAERLIYMCSTPVNPGGRIHTAYLASDRGRYFVPCLKCGVYDVLVPWLPEGHERTPDGSPPDGHQFTWPKGRPHLAHFVCWSCAREIPQADRAEMVEAGEWRAANPGAVSDDGRLHRGFHVWAALSPSPNAGWGQIATRVHEAVGNLAKLQVVANTDYGLPFAPVGEAPDWQHLYDRRESYEEGTVPAGVAVLTAGVDVQGNRLVYEVVGWGAGHESWSIKAGILEGNTARADDPVWADLSNLMGKTFPGANGTQWAIRQMAVDRGYNTDRVVGWVKRHRSRAMAVKGVGEDKPTADAILSVANARDRKPDGKAMKSGVVQWSVGSGRVKTELYGWLGMVRNDDGTFPSGYCHFPQYGADYFHQLTAEEKVTDIDENGRPVEVWKIKRDRQNHGLDARVYARAAAEHHSCRVAIAAASKKAEVTAKPADLAAPSTAKPPDPRPPLPVPRRPDRFGLDGGRPGGITDRPWRR
jgi:phage terminase large subunit GpA-like protein